MSSLAQAFVYYSTTSHERYELYNPYLSFLPKLHQQSIANKICWSYGEWFGKVEDSPSVGNRKVN